MAYETIIYDETEGVGTITLNRPEVMNALSTRMRSELLDALTRGAGSARVLVLTGAGRAFSAGQDLADAGDLDSLDLARVLAEEYEPILRAIHEAPVPVIAAVNGVAAGAGANLALTADVVIAAQSASFIQAFARIGLVPDAGGSYWLPRQAGFARAMGAALLAGAIPARKAESWGLIWEAVEDDAFEAHWKACAARLAKGPGVALQGIKRMMRASLSNDFDSQLALEARWQGIAGGTSDFREGVAAFLEKRPAVFRGV